MLRHNIACPFCGLCCDDLTVNNEAGKLTVDANGCALCEQGFFQSGDTGTTGQQAHIQGRACSLDDAVARAVELLRNARLPLIGGLGTDVAGARAALRLADRAGAVLDHMNSVTMLRNLLAVQDSGWMTATLGEVRNRADLLLVFGGHIEKQLPRFYERFFNEAESMFARHTGARELILIGRDADASIATDNVHTTTIPCPSDRLGEIAMTLRLLLLGQPLQAENVAGIAVSQLRDIVTRLADAQYGVVAWAASELDFPHAELAVQAFSGLVKDLNTTTRCSGLPLGGNNGDYTFSQVATWQAGYATRISLAHGCPHFDPIQFHWERLLKNDEVDLLLWISAFDAKRTPPAGKTPAIVLGRAGMQCGAEAEVFIPVATPGIDHNGHLYRCDSVVAVPLSALRVSDLPQVSGVLHAITESL